jgi:hypothetical protein
MYDEEHCVRGIGLKAARLLLFIRSDNLPLLPLDLPAIARPQCLPDLVPPCCGAGSIGSVL